MVIVGLVTLSDAITAGHGAAFGNMIAKNEHGILCNRFSIYEEMVNILGCFLLSVAAIMVIPFVMLYTAGVTDVNYRRELFSFVFCLSALFRCMLLPYQMLSNASGLFKIFQKQAMTETVINIVISLVLVKPLGILGVIIGTLTAYAYRTIIYGMYMAKHVVEFGYAKLCKRLCVTLVSFCGMFLLSKLLINISPANYFEWIIQSAVVSVACAVIILGTEWLFFRRELKGLARFLLPKL